MVVISVEKPFQHKSFSINNWTAAQLDNIKRLITKRDRDFVIIIDGEEGTGKCQPADSKVLMANGEWENIQNIKVGDKVLSPQQDGTTKFATVLKTTRWFCNDVYDIISINRRKKLYSCSHNHIIPINYRPDKKADWRVEMVTPKDILNNSKKDFSKNNTAITCPAIKEFYGRQNCIIEPYTLGAMLGDGCLNASGNFNITIADEEIMREIEKTYVIMSVNHKKNCKAKSYRFSRHNYYTKIKALSLFDELKEVGLIGKRSGDKFIPKEALYSDIEYRKKLLAGLIDTDGWRASGKSYEITTKSVQLAEDMQFLISSLGGRCDGIKKVIKNITRIGFSGEYCLLRFNFPYDIDLPIQVMRKKNKFREDGKYDSYKIGIHTLRSEKTKSCMVYGFELEGSHLYITDNYLVTHNSTFASQIAYYVDRTFNMERMCLTPSDFKEKIANAEKGQAVVFDEAYTGLASRSALSEINKSLVEMMMEMRKKNLFVILCIPSFFYLEKYAALHRARALFHCYFKNGNPGRYLVYNQKKMRILYLVGKKKMSYSFPSVHKKCEFYQGTPLDWKSYEDKKIAALKGKSKSSRTEKHEVQREFFCWLMIKQGWSLRKVEEIAKKSGIEMSNDAVRDAAKSFAAKHLTVTSIDPPKTPKNKQMFDLSEETYSK